MAEKPDLLALEHAECPDCSAKPGDALLCAACLHNRDAIIALQARIKNIQVADETLAKALWKFAPDLMEQLVDRYKAATGALDHFLGFLRERE